MRHRLALIAALATVPRAAAAATAPTTEVAATAGYSTQGTAAVASQLRVFGELRPGLRFYVEAAGADHSGRESDAFAAAYDYRNRLEAGETYVERQFPAGRAQSGLRVGRYRTPFGIYNSSDYAYGGFLRPPLIRYGYVDSVSNYWIEGGADYFIGIPLVQLEASLGAPEEAEATRTGPNAVLRLQGYHGPVILGASFLETRLAPAPTSRRGAARFLGLDGRWMAGGLQLRGEWIRGSSAVGPRSRGWYVEAMVHRRGLGPVTPVLRWEQYRFDLPGQRVLWRRWTAGARVRITPSLAASVNFIQGWEGALDVGLTHTVRF